MAKRMKELVVENVEVPVIEVVGNVEVIADKFQMPVKMVLIYNDNGDYIIHGCNSESPQAMFKALTGLWPLDPAVESVRFLELTLTVPEIAKLPKIRLYGTE